jgi:hypothetical protein
VDATRASDTGAEPEQGDRLLFGFWLDELWARHDVRTCRVIVSFIFEAYDVGRADAPLDDETALHRVKAAFETAMLHL